MTSTSDRWGPVNRWASLLVSAASGYSLIFAFPGFNFWWVAPLCMAGFYWSSFAHSKRWGFLTGLTFGLAYMLPVISWTNIFVGDLPWLALSLLEALFFGLLGLTLPVLHRGFKASWIKVLGFSGLFVAAEYARSYAPFGGFPWARLAFSQADSPLKSLASLGGPPLLGFAVCVVGACLAIGVRNVVTSRVTFQQHRSLAGSSKRRAESALWPLVTAVLVVLVGVVLPLQVAPESGGIKVAAIQGSQEMPTSLSAGASPEEVLGNHLRVTSEMLDAGYQPDLIIWPESSTDISPESDPNVKSAIQSVTARAQAPLLVGTQDYTPDKNRYNLAQLWVPKLSSVQQGPLPASAVSKSGQYAKMRPAPFAEYIPYPGFFRLFSSAVDLVTAQMLPGKTVGALRVAADQNMSGRAFTLGVGICFEVAYDDTMRNTVRAGAQLVAVPTNNATFGLTDESVQQLAMSQIQAITLGRSVVQASTVGVSGIILPNGDLVARSGHWTSEYLTATVPLRTSQTLATQLGDLAPIGLSALGCVALFAAALRLGARNKIESRLAAHVA